MDADPWANAPSTPKIPSAPTSPAKAIPPAARAVEAGPSSPPVRPPSPPPAEVPEPLVESPTAALAQEDISDAPTAFDDFDDFDEPAAGPSTFTASANANEEDAFGDFGDFEEGDFVDPVPPAPAPVVPHQPEWTPLRLRPFPPLPELLSQLSDTLRPLVPPPGSMSSDPPRLTGGLGQILGSESARDAYAQLTTPPMLKPLDWTRSRVRREHLISMGVPVNLDEVDSHRLSALPPLRITTGMAPPQRKRSSLDANGKGKSRDPSPLAGANGRQGTRSLPASAHPGFAPSGTGKYGLGPRPELDMEKAEQLCGLEEDALSMRSLANLKALQEDLASTSANASALLAWLLQLKDGQTQDSATYNGMISELIANAAKAKSASVGTGGVFRKSSQRQSSTNSRPMSVSGNVTPRMGSPMMW